MSKKGYSEYSTELRFFLGESFFEFLKMDIYKCPKMKSSDIYPRKN
jgi:hypothetical protein